MRKLILTLFLLFAPFAWADVQAPMPNHGVHLVSLIAMSESYSLFPYYATQEEKRKNIVTCGYGKTIGVKITDTCPIGKELLWLADHVRETAGAVWALSARNINCNQLAAATSLSYNIGTGAFTKSTMRRLILEGKMEEAGKQILLWDRQSGIQLKGLTKRRQAEYAMWNTPPTNCKGG